MDIGRFERIAPTEWRINPRDAMRVPAILYADETLIAEMDDKVWQQMVNVAALPGIVRASYAMPDAHWGYGFPIGGVAAFDADEGGIISGGGVGFDISCGVRTLTTGLARADLAGREEALVMALFRKIPTGVGSTGDIHLDDGEMTAMLAGGARWAVDHGWGLPEDLDRTEERGRMQGAEPRRVSPKARRRQQDEMGTLGSGNHYLEVQRVAHIYDPVVAEVFGLVEDQLVVSIHCGSRGLGHQIGTEFLRDMAIEAEKLGIDLPEPELACAPLRSDLGRAYLGAMRAGINCALANRQIITHLTRTVFARFYPDAELRMLYDVSHNTCKEEVHDVAGEARTLFVHRKGATRSVGPGHPSLPDALRDVGQPVLIGGSMGTASYILAGTAQSEARAFSSACHGAGRRMSRNQARKRWRGRDVSDELLARGIWLRSPSSRGVAEEAPGAYKDVDDVVEVAERAGLARRVARVEPVLCIKG